MISQNLWDYLCNVGGMQDASTSALHLADMRCLPGMEGAPVLDAGGALVGMMAVPLSNSTFEAEVEHWIYIHCMSIPSASG